MKIKYLLLTLVTFALQADIDDYEEGCINPSNFYRKTIAQIDHENLSEEED